jgi:hypothetical protein
MMSANKLSSKMPTTLLAKVIIVLHVVVVIIVVGTTVDVHGQQTLKVHCTRMQIVCWREGIVKTVSLIGVIRIFVYSEAHEIWIQPVPLATVLIELTSVWQPKAMSDFCRNSGCE